MPSRFELENKGFADRLQFMQPCGIFIHPLNALEFLLKCFVRNILLATRMHFLYMPKIVKKNEAGERDDETS